jgi:hypothetical protein
MNSKKPKPQAIALDDVNVSTVSPFKDQVKKHHLIFKINIFRIAKNEI